MLPEWASYTILIFAIVLLIIMMLSNTVQEWMTTWKNNRDFNYWLTEGEKYSTDNKMLRARLTSLIGNREDGTYGYPWIDDFGPCVYCHGVLLGEDDDEPSVITQHEIDCPFELALQYLEGKS